MEIDSLFLPHGSWGWNSGCQVPPPLHPQQFVCWHTCNTEITYLKSTAVENTGNFLFSPISLRRVVPPCSAVHSPTHLLQFMLYTEALNIGKRWWCWEPRQSIVLFDESQRGVIHSSSSSRNFLPREEAELSVGIVLAKNIYNCLLYFRNCARV